ncbi:MAG: hypothetical protein M0Z94_04605 [Dehalococcoidales bacterium]|nr:hypothetical protein [Dehalococcoidales bacterium]
MRSPGDAGGGNIGREESCPHLGLEGDQSSISLKPSPRHRCYLWMERSRIDLTHQARFCLTDSHSICPWLSIGGTPTARLDSAVFQLRRAARWVLERSSRRALAIAATFWTWSGTFPWPKVRYVARRGLRYLGSWGQQALVGLGHFALRLGAMGWDLSGRLGAGIGRLAATEPVPSTMPADPPAVEEVPPAPPQTPSLDRLPMQKATLIWQCDACETINTGPLRVCHWCGRPSPPVEEALMSSGDELLAQGLAGLKAGNEELAYDYFAKACEASPSNELAWHWRAKTAPTVDEVISCLQRLLEINPGNANVRADLKWALQRRKHAQPEQARPDQKRRAAAESRSQRVTVQLRRITDELRWWVLQLAAVCAFALALVLTIPYVRLAGPPDRPELGEFLALLPALDLPKLTVHASSLPAFDVGPALPLLLGLLLLQAAFSVARRGGLGTRVRMALLAAVAGGLMLHFGTNPPAPWYAAGLAAVAVVGALLGGAPVETREHDGTFSVSRRR